MSSLFLYFCLVHGRLGLNWLQMGPGGVFPINPDLANILGDMDVDFENFYVFYFSDSKFQIPRFQISKNLAWARLTQIGLGLGHPPSLGAMGDGLGWDLGVCPVAAVQKLT